MRPSREDILEIRLQEPPVPEVGQLGIRIRGNLVVDVKVGSLVLVEEQSAESGTVSDVDDFTHLFWQRDIEQVFDSGEDNVLELLLSGHLA